MKVRIRFLQVVRCVTLMGVCLALATGNGFAAAKSKKSKPKSRRPISVTKIKFDPSAEKVKLFDALQNGQLDAVLIPKDEKQGQVLIQNKSKKPLTVEVPASSHGRPWL